MAQASAWPLLTVEQAVGLALHAASPPLPTERRAPAAAARARAALAAPLHAPRAVPPFAASIKDGYAVRAADCAAPGADGAVTLAVAGASRAGDSDSESIGRLPALAASYITTGAPLPDGADAVVQVENVTLADDGQSVRVPAGIAAGQDVRQEGSDIAVGSEVIASGTVLTPADVGLAAMCGAAEVEVYGTPLVGVASTGNELFDSAAGATGGADCAAAPGASQIYDANRPMLLAAVEAAVGDARDYGIICDTRDAVERVVDAAAADGADMLILSGGVSMGDRDYVKGVLSARGQVLCGRVLMKPGKPLTVATVPSEASRNGSMLVLGLPGNPVRAPARRVEPHLAWRARYACAVLPPAPASRLQLAADAAAGVAAGTSLGAPGDAGERPRHVCARRRACSARACGPPGGHPAHAARTLRARDRNQAGPRAARVPPRGSHVARSRESLLSSEHRAADLLAAGLFPGRQRAPRAAARRRRARRGHRSVGATAR